MVLMQVKISLIIVATLEIKSRNLLSLLIMNELLKIAQDKQSHCDLMM